MRVQIDGVEYVPAPPVQKVFASLGEALRVLRAQTGMTLEAAGKATDTSKSYIWELENDRSVPGLDLAARIARVYGVPLELLGACFLTAPEPRLNANA